MVAEDPTPRQLRILALRSAIPMIGFGFMDNLVMIQAGEAIDMSIGVMFGLSTLTAAGFGQCVSDVAGLTCGGIVDATVAKMNLPRHGLSPAQLDLRKVRITSTVGGCVGVVIGCLLGMTSLLFMDTNRAEKAKKAKELTSIFESVMKEGHKLVNAERATLWIIDDDGKLWSRVATGTKEDLHLSLDSGIVGYCARTGEVVNTRNAYADSRFSQEIDRQSGFHTKTLLTTPVKGEDGEVIGVIQMVNKKEDQAESTFNANDEKLAQMLAFHVATFLRIVS